MIVLGIITIAIAAAVVIAMTIRRRCPACHRRGLVVERHYKRAHCVHCKAEFAHVDGGYVPIKPAVVAPPKERT